MSALGPAGLYLAPGGQSVGRPAPRPGSDRSFSPRLDPAESALATGQSGLPNLHSLGWGDPGSIDQPRSVAIDRSDRGGLGPLDDASGPGDVGDPAQTVPIQQAAAFDPFAWLARLRTNLLDWSTTPANAPSGVDAARTDGDPAADPSKPGEEPTDLANFSPGQGIGLTVLVTVGYHRLFSRRALRSRRLKQRRAVALLVRQS